MAKFTTHHNGAHAEVTGSYRLMVGWFGYLYAEVKLEFCDGTVIWKRANQMELDHCLSLQSTANEKHTSGGSK